VGFLAGRLAAELEEAGERLGERLRKAALHARRSPSPCWHPKASLRPLGRVSGPPIPPRGPPVILVSA
jgi:hypothetical protein